MTTTDDLIEQANRAGEHALYSTETESGWYGQPECAKVARIVAPAVLAAVEPLIRADERRKALTEAADLLRPHPNATFRDVTEFLADLAEQQGAER